MKCKNLLMARRQQPRRDALLYRVPVADKKASTIHKVCSEGELGSISYRPLPKQKVAPSVFSREALQSRVSVLKDVLDALKDPLLNMIGVCGMGGIGKTTLAKEAHRQRQADKLFNIVVMVAVSQTPDHRRIQAEIAEVLGVHLVEEGLLVRANWLIERLKNEKILIILDDIWNYLQLEEVGIPFGDDCKGCKLLLTSRSHGMLSREVRTQKVFKLEVLWEEEAWSLFEMTVNDTRNQALPPIAPDVAKQCGGLPLLILRVAVALREKNSYVWNDKLKQLSDFRDEEIQAKVHSVLQSSYDNLHSTEVKSFFLLCGLFGLPNIQIKNLLMYSIGLGLFKVRGSVEDARNRVFSLIDELKAKSLLLDGDIDGCVKMHDIVRDTAMSIASRVQHAYIGSSGFGLNELRDKKCTRISLPYNNIRELPIVLEFPNAELFYLISDDLSVKISDLFFEGIRQLKVLDFTGLHFRSLPSSLDLVANLHTLCLNQGQLDDIAVIGELKQLEVLSFAESYIVELSRQIEHLTRLKLLDLSNCSMLKVIPKNVLSKLSSL